MKKIIALLLILTACGGFTTQRAPAKLPDVYTGTSALELGFTEASTNEILMCQEGSLMVSLENKGAFDIVDGKLLVVSDEALVFEESSKSFSLKGKSQFEPSGGFDLWRVRFANVGLPRQLEQYSADVVVQACYKYETSASAVVCIDPDVDNLNPRKPCRSSVVGLSGGQGAPVEVVSVEPLMVPFRDSVHSLFKIRLRHSGVGQVVAFSQVDAACTQSAKAKFGGVVKATVELQGKKLSCNIKDNLIPLEVVGDTEIICESEQDIDISQGTYTTPLFVKLDYGYINTGVFPVNVKRIKGQEECR